MADHDTARDAALEAALRDLGRRLDVPPPPDVTDVTAAVRARLAAPPPTAGRRRRLRRAVAAVAAMVLAFAAVTAASPAVRAALVDLLRFAGVEIRQEPGPPVSGTGELPGARRVDLAEARRAAAFPVLVADALGRPDEVLLSDGRPPRVVSLLYLAGPGRPAPAAGDVAVRLDEFDAQGPPAFEKFAASSGVERVSVGSSTGIWVPGPHEVLYVDRTGTWRAESAHLAANTLIWRTRGVTLRLEGRYTKAEALAVARTVR